MKVYIWNSHAMRDISSNYPGRIMVLSTSVELDRATVITKAKNYYRHTTPDDVYGDFLRDVITDISINPQTMDFLDVNFEIGPN